MDGVLRPDPSHLQRRLLVEKEVDDVAVRPGQLESVRRIAGNVLHSDPFELVAARLVGRHDALGPVVGYKIALTTAAMRRMVGLEAPIAGDSLHDRVYGLQTPAQRKAFEMLFLRPHQRAPGVPFAWHTAADVLAQRQALRHPDFVVARKRGQFWQVREKVFDYQGRFRRANQLA